jgi:hypothetical protein
MTQACTVLQDTIRNDYRDRRTPYEDHEARRAWEYSGLLRMQ